MGAMEQEANRTGYAMGRKAVLLVEGYDDLQVVRALCAAHRPPLEQFGIFACGGVDKLLGGDIENFLQDAKRTHVGIIVDANAAGVRSRGEAVRQKIKGLPGKAYAGFPPIPPEGLVFKSAAASRPHVGVWVMPNNKAKGALEDFLLPTIKPKSANRFIEGTLSVAKRLGFTTYKPCTQEKKAQLQTYLAWQDRPGMPLGRGITRRTFDLNHVNIRCFMDWLAQLYGVG